MPISSLESGAVIGVISDTHGLLRPGALTTLRGVQLIIHAGDIGRPEVIEQLEQLAPVAAVRGNNDQDRWAMAFPESRHLSAGGRNIFVLHNIRDFVVDPFTPAFAVVISGHSHRPSIQHRDGCIFLNPGSAGPRRFNLPVSLAKLHVTAAGFKPQLITLKV